MDFQDDNYDQFTIDFAVGKRGRLTVGVFKENSIGRRFYESYGFHYIEETVHEGSGQLVLQLALPSE